MPSFASLASVALALASIAAPAYAFEASELDISPRAVDLTDSIFGAQLEKRRPNHALAYGYPFGLPKTKGPRKKMTPGGYVDKRPQNLGTKCTRDNQCSVQGISLAAGQCQNGVCGFRCLGDTKEQGNTCVGVFKAQACKNDWNCPRTRLAHARSVCSDNLCTFSCSAGYTAEGNKCVRSSQRCGRTRCKPVENGSNYCQGNKCVPQCETYLGYALYTNADQSVYRCINTAKDADNCGSVGNVCPDGYNGKGQPFCNAGKCDLNCRGFRSKQYRRGVPFCTDGHGHNTPRSS